jgi:hypothetical protein
MGPVNDRSPSRIRAALAASHEETAAVVAAIERFMRVTRPLSAPAGQSAEDGWRLAAAQESLARAERHDLPDPWINT